ncbi:hypothetical protein MN608_00153 [Microdochium nivale]|nr:hypothetical protein MN608_00153 [Microdochium nivale]
MLIFLVLFTIPGTFIGAFQCDQLKYIYDLEFDMAPDRAEHYFKAHTSWTIFMYQAIVIFTCDIVMFLLPTPALLRLNLSVSRR